MLHSGDRIWVNIPHVGYVGVGIVTGEMQPANEAILDVDGVSHPMSSLELKGDYINPDADPETQEYVVPVKWIKTVPQQRAVKEAGFFGNQNSVCRPQTDKWRFTIERLKTVWEIA